MLRFFVALVAAKMAKLAITILKPITHSEGSHFPGQLALKICPYFLSRAARPNLVIAVTGTNGKTTLSNMLSDVFQHAGYTVISNRWGSNMEPGVASILSENSTLSNRSRAQVAVVEVDEKSSKRIYSRITPDYLVCTQFTRDSMMRNAHPYYIFDFVNNNLPNGVKMILNADDLISSSLKKENPRAYYSIAKQPFDVLKKSLVNDAKVCPICNSPLTYDYTRYDHIGYAHCDKCGFTSPEADYVLTDMDYEKRIIRINCKGTSHEFHMVSDGIFNTYDQLAAISLFVEYGLDIEKIKSAFEDLHVVESRYMTDEIDGVEFTSNMTKSLIAPACSAIFDYITSRPKEKEIVLFIEDPHTIDNNAYMYETDFEYFNNPSVNKIIIVGKRPQEFYLRFLFAGVPKEKMVQLGSIEEIDKHLSFKRGTAIYLLYDNYQVSTNTRAREIIKKALEGGAAHD
ncbi:MAG: DUF1727 domain-containing protein [Firmicutes bacterium]|nr:DUF1727 domain-containing protein [Bacillota bacterium]